MTEKHVYVVMNPVAGTDEAGDVRQIIEQSLDEAGWSYDIHETQEDEDVESVTRKALSSGYDIVIASGGDGTVSAVAGALIHTGVKLGIIPSGTGNALARDIDIPLDQAEAMALITGSHDIKTIDAMAVDDRHYFLNVSVGMSAAAMADTERSEKRKLGMLAYVITIVKKLLGLQSTTFEVTVDAKQMLVQAADVMVANSGLMGITEIGTQPEILLDDGEVNVFIVRARSLWDYVMALWDALIDSKSPHSHIRILTARNEVMIDPRGELRAQADGEPLEQGSVSIKIIPQAVELIIPQAQAG